MLRSPPNWIKGFLLVLFLSVGTATVIAAIVFFYQLIRFTYCMGHAGLILRPVACVICILTLSLSMMQYMRTHKKSKHKKSKLAALCVIISIFLVWAFDVVPTMRDLTAHPVTETHLASVTQKDYDVYIQTNAPLYIFPSSMLEVLRDQDGAVIFTPFVMNSFQNMNRRRMFSDYYYMTIVYYPHSKTRISTTIQGGTA